MVYLPPELGWATTVMTYTTVSRALPWQGHVYIKISRSISNSIAISFLGHILGQKGGWARPVPGTMDGARLAWSIQLEIKMNTCCDRSEGFPARDIGFLGTLDQGSAQIPELLGNRRPRRRRRRPAAGPAGARPPARNSYSSIWTLRSIICGGTARYGHWGPIIGHGNAKNGPWGPK